MINKVAVVTTVYNGEQYLNRAIPSILKQTYTDFEWIIVNDGSTDSTFKLINEIAQKDSRIKLLSPGRLGFAKALNYGIENTQAEYIVRQDFDDISYQDRLRLQIEFLDAHPEVGIVGCNYIVEDDNRKERYERVIPKNHDELIKTMAKCVPFAHTLVTFRKEAWLQAGGYSEPNNLVDIRLWIKFAALGWQFGCVPQALGEHFVYAKSFWHQNFQYSHRQKHLAKVQWQAIRELNLPLWMAVYPLGRYVYCYSPQGLKSFLRRTVVGSRERDLELKGL